MPALSRPQISNGPSDNIKRKNAAATHFLPAIVLCFSLCHWRAHANAPMTSILISLAVQDTLLNYYGTKYMRLDSHLTSSLLAAAVYFQALLAQFLRVYQAIYIYIYIYISEEHIWQIHL